MPWDSTGGAVYIPAATRADLTPDIWRGETQRAMLVPMLFRDIDTPDNRTLLGTWRIR
jgi:hypothetical protein